MYDKVLKYCKGNMDSRIPINMIYIYDMVLNMRLPAAHQNSGILDNVTWE